MALAMQNTLPCLFSSSLSSLQPAEEMTSTISFLFAQRIRSKCLTLASKASCHLAPAQSLSLPHMHQSRAVIFTSMYCHQALLKAAGIEGRGTRSSPSDHSQDRENVTKTTRNTHDWSCHKGLKETVYQGHVLGVTFSTRDIN